MHVRHSIYVAQNEGNEDLTKDLSKLFRNQRYDVRFILPDQPVSKGRGVGRFPTARQSRIGNRRAIPKEIRRSPPLGPAGRHAILDAPRICRQIPPLGTPAASAIPDAQKDMPPDSTSSDPDEYEQSMSADGSEYYYYQPIRAATDVLYGMPSDGRPNGRAGWIRDALAGTRSPKPWAT